jgi:hypothetical protein
MSRYRIVARRGRTVSVFYYAQVKLLGLFWVDLPWCSTGGYGDWQEGGESPSTQVHLVENYIEMYRDGFGDKTKVVKEFY